MKKKHKKILALTMLTSMFALTSGYFYINDKYKKASAEADNDFQYSQIATSWVAHAVGSEYITTTDNLTEVEGRYDTYRGQSTITLNNSEATIYQEVTLKTTLEAPIEQNLYLAIPKYVDSDLEISRTQSINIKGIAPSSNNQYEIPINIDMAAVPGQNNSYIYNYKIYINYSQNSTMTEIPQSNYPNKNGNGLPSLLEAFRSATNWTLYEEGTKTFTLQNQKFILYDDLYVNMNLYKNTWTQIYVIEYLTQNSNRDIMVRSAYNNEQYPMKNEESTLYGRWVTNITQPIEVIDIGGLMWQILTMPFTFISVAFDLTLFAGTPYYINLSEIFLGVLAIIIFITLIKIIIKMTMSSIG